LALAALPLGALAGCQARDARDGSRAVVFRHPKLFGNPEPFAALVAGFERATGIAVRRSPLPAASDEQHLFYAINFQARSQDFDVVALDTIWTAEFAQAGWLRDLTHLLPPDERADLFPGPLDSALWRGRVHALPWFADVGLLYYRSDLLARRGLAPPRTWDELVAAAGALQRERASPHGFVWQGKQYEGLVCDALEFVWSHGGDLEPAHGAAAARGLAFMRSLVTGGVTPAFVTTLTEEPSRVIFGRGDAAFLRNWPYAWKLFERKGSPVRGRVGVALLPRAEGGESAATLGGWLLGVSAFSPRAEAAERFAAFLASPEAQKALALAYGYSPPRRSLYRDAELAAAQPFTASLAAVLEAARPRPVSPYYVAWSQTLQGQFSAVLTGRRTPAEALATIQRTRETPEAR
jgi:multiple sugar transport system substrate-binding protein